MGEKVAEVGSVTVATGNRVLPWDHEKSISWTHTWETVVWQGLFEW